MGGFVLDLFGLGSEIGAVAVAAHEDKEHGDELPSGLVVGLVVGGVAAALAGSVMMIAGQPHVYDAINIYNDSVEVRPSAPALGPRVQ